MGTHHNIHISSEQVERYARWKWPLCLFVNGTHEKVNELCDACQSAVWRSVGLAAQTLTFSAVYGKSEDNVLGRFQIMKVLHKSEDKFLVRFQLVKVFKNMYHYKYVSR